MSDMGISQALEQMGAFVRDFAPVVRRYFESLVEAGFAPPEAMRLTISWQEAFIGNQFRRQPPEGP